MNNQPVQISDQIMKTQGYVTIATGSEKYYKLAHQLLLSYRKFASNQIPFAIICDCENEYTKDFDDVQVISDAHCSYLDKLYLHRYVPYDETIFVDADSLFLADPSGLWEDFADEADVSCYGWRFPLHSNRGWYSVDGCGEYKDLIDYEVSLHGGIYFIRKGTLCDSIFNKARELAGEYHKYTFLNFDQPADEPVLALSMAIHKSYPCEKTARVLFYPGVFQKLHMNISGQLFLDGKPCNAEILHFATPNTERFVYVYLAHLVNTDYVSINFWARIINYAKIRVMTAPKDCKAIVRHTVGIVLRKILPNSTVTKIKRKLLNRK